MVSGVPGNASGLVQAPRPPLVSSLAGLVQDFPCFAYEPACLSFVNAEADDARASHSLGLACGNQRVRRFHTAGSWASGEPLVALRFALEVAVTCHKVIALSELVRSLPAAWLAHLRTWPAWPSRCVGSTHGVCGLHPRRLAPRRTTQEVQSLVTTDAVFPRLAGGCNVQDDRAPHDEAEGHDDVRARPAGSPGGCARVCAALARCMLLPTCMSAAPRMLCCMPLCEHVRRTALPVCGCLA